MVVHQAIGGVSVDICDVIIGFSNDGVSTTDSMEKG